ncbi:MAG: TetR/AcrR family transcriptional regulator [Phycisphaerales bacterium JB037]
MTPASDTRERILEAAARLFHEQGFAATGISTILREAGAHAGSLYHAFPNKESLLVGVLERYQRLLRPVVMDPVEAQEEDRIERIFVLLGWYRMGLEMTGCRLGCPIANIALEVSDTHPEVRPHIDANFDGWARAIERWLDEAGDRLPADLDRRALSRFILTVMEGGLMQARAKGSLEPFDDSVSQLRSYVDRLKDEAARGRGG